MMVRMNVLMAFIPLFVAIAFLTVASRLIVAPADGHRGARVSGDSTYFEPNRRNFWGVYMFSAAMAYGAIAALVGGLNSAGGILTFIFCLGFAFLIFAVFPGTIVSGPSGLEQRYWLWMSKKIAWSEIRSIDNNEKKKTLTIYSAAGTKIQHTKILPERDRLVADLRAHCANKLPASLAPQPPETSSIPESAASLT